MAWDELEESINSTFSGGYCACDDGRLKAYRHGINTAFNVMRHQFPDPDVCHYANELDGAVRYMADPANWDEETGLLKRPGGSQQVGIVLYSATIKPWIFAAQFIHGGNSNAGAFAKTE